MKRCTSDGQGGVEPVSDLVIVLGDQPPGLSELEEARPRSSEAATDLAQGFAAMGQPVDGEADRPVEPALPGRFHCSPSDHGPSNHGPPPPRRLRPPLRPRRLRPRPPRPAEASRASDYDNQDLTSLKVTRTDPTVAFDWGSGSPDPSVGPNELLGALERPGPGAAQRDLHVLHVL